MKKTLVLIIMLVLVFVLSACGYNTNSTPVSNTAVFSESTDSYIGNANTKKFHIPSCYTLPEEKNRVYFTTIDEATQNGYVPCENCQP